jgi:hypothetical protein
MPDEHGALSEADLAIIRKWWDQHWREPVVCPVCKTSEWRMANHVLKVHRHGFDAFKDGTTIYPYIVVMCATCAHTMFFNSAKIGLPPPSAPTSSSTARNPLFLPLPQFPSTKG